LWIDVYQPLPCSLSFLTIRIIYNLEEIYFMKEQPDFASFFNDNKKLAKDYFETRINIYRLRLIGILSRSAGYIIWISISLFLFFLFSMVVTVVAGLWFSDLTGSYIKGFGIVALIILLKIFILTRLRKPLFINPIIRKIIESTQNENTEGPPEF
jgi:hypothetical protein